MSEKLTPWFDGELYKPAYPGVYQQMSGSGSELGYQRWDGSVWYTWHRDENKAARSYLLADPVRQSDNWRGLAKDPSTK